MSKEGMHNQETRDYYLNMATSTTKALRQGILTLDEYCSNFFLSMVSTAIQGNEFVWKPCLELIPRDLLEELSKFGDLNYKSIDYAVDSVGKFFGFSSEAASPQMKSKISATFRRFHQEIDRRIRNCDRPSGS